MTIFMFTLITFIAICLLLICCVSTYNRYQDYIIRINECEANIDSTLRKRFDLLNKSRNIIKTNTKTKNEVLEIITKLRSRKLTNFDLDRQLYEAINEFEQYKEEFESLKKCDKYLKIEISLHESEAEIEAFRKYYNDIITDYNKMVRSFPTNFVAKVCGYKIRTYYDGKITDDDITNDFKF